MRAASPKAENTENTLLSVSMAAKSMSDEPATLPPGADHAVEVAASRVRLATAAARHTAEGVKSCGPILELARVHGVDMPITEQVVALVHSEGRMPVREMAARLLERPRKPEAL